MKLRSLVGCCFNKVKAIKSFAFVNALTSRKHFGNVLWPLWLLQRVHWGSFNSWFYLRPVGLWTKTQQKCSVTICHDLTTSWSACFFFNLQCQTCLIEIEYVAIPMFVKCCFNLSIILHLTVEKLPSLSLCLSAYDTKPFRDEYVSWERHSSTICTFPIRLIKTAFYFFQKSRVALTSNGSDLYSEWSHAGALHLALRFSVPNPLRAFLVGLVVPLIRPWSRQCRRRLL